MQVAGTKEDIFRIGPSHLERWKKAGKSTACHSCQEEFEAGQLCHSKDAYGNDATRRHVLCAIKVGALQMTILDYKIWAAGLKKEKELFEKLLMAEARKVEHELQEQIQTDYPYLKVNVSVVSPGKVKIRYGV